MAHFSQFPNLATGNPNPAISEKGHLLHHPGVVSCYSSGAPVLAVMPMAGGQVVRFVPRIDGQSEAFYGKVGTIGGGCFVGARRFTTDLLMTSPILQGC